MESIPVKKKETDIQPCVAHTKKGKGGKQGSSMWFLGT